MHQATWNLADEICQLSDSVSEGRLAVQSLAGQLPGAMEDAWWRISETLKPRLPNATEVKKARVRLERESREAFARAYPQSAASTSGQIPLPAGPEGVPVPQDGSHHQADDPPRREGQPVSTTAQTSAPPNSPADGDVELVAVPPAVGLAAADLPGILAAVRAFRKTVEASQTDWHGAEARAHAAVVAQAEDAIRRLLTPSDPDCKGNHSDDLADPDLPPAIRVVLRKIWARIVEDVHFRRPPFAADRRDEWLVLLDDAVAAMPSDRDYAAGAANAAGATSTPDGDEKNPEAAMLLSTALLSAPELAKQLGANPDAVESFLRRYRESFPDCCITVDREDRRRNEAKYRYRIADVWPALCQRFRKNPK
jgi:hypothetical protein